MSLRKAIHTQGTYLNIGKGAEGVPAETDVYLKFHVTSLSRTGSTTEQIDVTTMCDEGIETIPGTTDYGSVTAEYQYLPSAEAQKVLQEYEDTKRRFNAQIIYPDDGQGKGEVKVLFIASIESFSVNAGINDALRASLSLKINGKPKLVMPTA